jgi:hypothetical protein
MTAYPIPKELAGAYHGAGHALAAITNGQLIRFVYLSDVLPDFDPTRLESAVTDNRLTPTVRELQALGLVSVGMLSGREFTEL